MGRPSEPGTRGFAVGVGYLAISTLVLRPPMGQLSREIAAGTEPCDTVPFALAWAIGWGHSRIDEFGAGYWDAPIFHPTAGAFALSESMPFLALMTWPAHAVGLPLAACINLALVATLVANGWFVRRWLLRLRAGHPLATVGGAIASMLPFVHQELGVLPLVVLWPMVWMLTAAVDLLRARGPRGGWRAAAELGLATAVSIACCGQLALATALLVIPCAAWFLRADHFGLRTLTQAVLAITIAAAGAAPVVLPQRATLDALGLRRDDRSQDRGGARPAALLRTPWPELLPLPASMVAERPGDRAFVPGVVRVAMAAVGLAVGLSRRRSRRQAAMLMTLVAGALILAFASRIQVLGFEPSEWLADHVPGYGQIRAVFRAVVLAQLGVVVLAVLGLRALQVRVRALRRRPWLVIACAVVMLVELVPPPPRWTPLPDPDAAWVRWLRDEAEPGAAIAWIPFAATAEVCDHEDTAAAMVLGLEHRHPLVNGYSSFFPAEHNRTSRAARMLPQGRGVVALRRHGTRYLVAPDGGPLTGIDEARRQRLAILPAFRDEAEGITVFWLEP